MKRGIVDLSSVVWTCLLAGKDSEFGKEYRIWDELVIPLRSEECRAQEKAHGEGKKLFVNSASYGYENAINHIKMMLDATGLQPRDLILVPEGRDSKANRQFLHPGYKAGRDRTPEQYVEFRACRDMLQNALLRAGAQAIWQDGGVEADDVIGYLALNLEGERIIVSGDKDLAVLVNPDAGIRHWRKGVWDENPFGDFDHKLITMYIALVGDSSDKIPGCKGFGDSGENSAWKKMWAAFGDEGLTLMDGLIRNKELKRLEEDVDELPLLQKIIDDAENVYMSYELGRLMVEKVNTARRPLSFKAGMVHPAATCEDERLRSYSGVNRIISAETYDKAVPWILKEIQRSPYVTLDVETSTPPESDEWLEGMDKAENKTPVDVIGSELTSLQLTFGPNMQHSVYFPINNVEEEGVTNLTIAQVRDLVAQIPKHKVTYIHNVGFELPVCFNAWGKDWENDPEYHGFLRNVRCTAMASSYVDENFSSGLKSLSSRLLGYDQKSYLDTVSRRYLKNEWNGVGKIVSSATEVDGEESVESIIVEHKMNQLRARELVEYGCDDTICTSALINHFQVVMELEKTWKVFNEVETWAAYVQAKGFVDGSAFSLERMSELEKEDDAKYDAAWEVLRPYLIKIGFDGTVTPKMHPQEYLDDLEREAMGGDDPLNWKQPNEVLLLNPAGIKTAFRIIMGEDMPKTMVRTLSKLAKLIEQWADDNGGNTAAYLFAKAVNDGDLDTINQLISDNYDGEPVLELGSSKQMCHLLYDVLALPVNLCNDATALEKKHTPELAQALQQHRQWRMGKVSKLTEAELKLVRKKAKANDDAIEFAIAFNADLLDEEMKAALRAIGDMKTVMTRRSLFYKNYWKLVHWKTKKIHPSIRQCGAVTRRPTSSNPNVYQLPKKGEGVKFRECYVPHHKDAVVVSEDFNGQELRLAAERSQDKNMLACYVGDNKKDLHSITAAGAMKLKWGSAAVSEYMATYGSHLPETEAGQYDMFMLLRSLPEGSPIKKLADDLRKNSKNVNFTAQFGGQALKVSETLIMLPSDAQLFLDARSKMFPDVDKAAKRAEEDCRRTGYALTMLGARRHLRDAILSDDKSAASRAARQAWNMEIQGSAGEMTKLAMGKLWRSGAMHRFDVRFIASIYDELAFSVNRRDALEFIYVLHSCMTAKYADMQVPIVGSISLGPNFAEQIECGEDYYPERITKALETVFSEEMETA